MKHCLLLLPVFFALACKPSGVGVAQSVSPLGTTIVVTSLLDERVTNGDCTIREAFVAANTNAAVDACPAGMAMPNQDVIQLPAGTATITLGAAAENANNGGDFDIAQSVIVTGPCPTRTVINAANADRALHIVNGIKIDVELHCLDIKNGCANGGTCTSQSATGPAYGGAIYHNAPGRFRMSNVRLRDGRGAIGSGFATCGDPPAGYDPIVSGPWIDAELTDFEIDHNTGGSGLFSHVDLRLIRANIHHNTANVASTFGAGVLITNKLTTCTDCTITDNTNTLFHGGGVAVVGQGTSTSRGEFVMTGGSLERNVANGHGGNLLVNGGSGGTDVGWGGTYCGLAPSGSHGCLAVLTNVDVGSGTADSPTTSPAGNGGGVFANGTGAAPSRVELRGSSTVSSNTDLSSSPVHAPDCSGTVYRYDTASVANTSGCTIVNAGPVCGNAIVETGEDCDDAANECCVACAFADSGASCDDSDACSLMDTCDGAGACLAGTGTTCGDGTHQPACGEQCDDGNTVSGDGCSSVCVAEECTCVEYVCE